MGRGTAGVKGMNVSQKGNQVLALEVARDEDELLVVTENGYGKRTPMSAVPGQGPRHPGRADDQDDGEEGRPRRRPDRAPAPGADLHLPERDGPAHRRSRGSPRWAAPTQGVRVMNLKSGDRVSAVALVIESTNGDGAGAEARPLEEAERRGRGIAEEAEIKAAEAGRGDGEAPRSTRRRAPTPDSAEAEPHRGRPPPKTKAARAKAAPKRSRSREAEAQGRAAKRSAAKKPAAKPKAKREGRTRAPSAASSARRSASSG